MPTKVIRQLELTYGTVGAQEPSPSRASPSPASQASWIKIVATEVVQEEPFSGRAAQQDASFDPAFPHEIDGELAD
jgi:hypothetical protein